MRSIVSAEDISYTYPQDENQASPAALEHVDIKIEKGEFVAVLGHNGSGKSTFAKHLNAILLPSGGAVYIDNMDTRDQSLLLAIRSRCGMVFQNPDNQLVATVVDEDVAFAPENMGLPPEEIRRRVDACLETVSRLMAPIAPYYADRLYTDLTAATGRAEAESVHLATFPVCDEARIDKSLEYRMELAQQITSMVLSLRKKEKIIVRQPLQCIAIPVGDTARQQSIEAVKQLILDEVNVKELRFVEGDGMLVKKVKCNFRTMGKKFGKLMKAVAAAMEKLPQAQIAALEASGTLDVALESGETVTVDAADVEIFSEDIPGWTVANEGSLTVALDITLTDGLRVEGAAREIVKRVQNLRKEQGFEITDRVAVTLSHSPLTDKAVADYGDYIRGQVLANTLTVADVENGAELEIDGQKVAVKVVKD